MATFNTSLSHLTESSFTLPPVPETTGDFVSDEESFVVLGHSFEDMTSLFSNVTPAVQTSIIDRIEQNVDNVLAELADNTDVPLPTVENHFQPAEKYPSTSTVISHLSSDEIEKKLSLLLDENQELKRTILQNNISMKSQYQRIVDWREDVQKSYQSHKEKFEEAKKFIITLKTENAEMKQKVEKQMQEISDLNNKLIEQTCSKNLDSLTLSKNSETYDKITELSKLLASSKDENEKLAIEIQRLNILLQSKSSDSHHVEDHLSGAIHKKVVNQELASCKEEQKIIRHQLMVAQQKITEMDHARSLQNQQLLAKDTEITKLGNLLKNFIYTEDDMYALKTQLDVYKADFETEKNAKETINSEKNQLAEDIQNLQVRNRQLQEEVELLRNHSDFSVLPNARSEPSHPTYECPKCHFGFNTYNALENHVHRCLDLDSTLP